jgi:hypothetical protein
MQTNINKLKEIEAQAMKSVDTSRELSPEEKNKIKSQIRKDTSKRIKEIEGNA